MKQTRQRLTYANVMSSIAVFLVLGGATAFAASQLGKNTVGSKQLKANSVTAGKIKNGAVTPSKISVAAQNALKGATGPAGPKGATGAPGSAGATGAPGSAVAYAHVLADGTVDLENSKNISSSNVTRTGPGVYCFPGLSFTVHAVTVSPDAYGPNDGIFVNPTFHGAPPYGGCGEDPRVRTTTAAAPSTASDHPFYIVFQ